MSTHGKPKGEACAVRARTVGLVALLCSSGCFFDLDIPTVPPNPPPPSLTVLAPQPGDTLTLSSEVSVQADSVNGVSGVSVLCGPLDGGARQAYAWASPPYIALVDFSVCQGLTSKNPDGGYPVLQLSVEALSDAGAQNQVDLQVQLNAAGPQFAVVFPPSAQPQSPFTVVVATDGGPFSSLPVVTLAGLSADSVTVSADGSDTSLTLYTAFFHSTPGLGTDNYPDGGVPSIVPIEVLTDTDEVVRLTVEATAANGNTTAVDLSVDLSRLVWDRYIPGQPAFLTPISWVAEPVAFDGGLVLPLAISNASVAINSPWIPGVLSKDDGTFYGFDVGDLLPGGLDGGYLARGINADGQTLFFDFSGKGSNLLLVPPPPAEAPLIMSSLVGPAVNPPLSRVDDFLCLQDAVAVCSDSTFEGLTCFTPELSAVTVRTPTLVFTGAPDSGVVAGGGGRYLSPNATQDCGATWNLVDLTAGTVSLGPAEDPNGVARQCFIQGISRLLAVGDGTFIVQLGSSCENGATSEFPILRVGAASAILGAYTAPLGTARPVRREVVGVLADGRVVTLRNAPPYTVFELWTMNPTTADAPQVISPIAGLYDSADNAEASVVARSVYAAANGSFAVLLNGAPLGVGVVAFGPSLSPLWLYLYPRVTSTANARLVSAPTSGDVYLLDGFNNRAVSLRVESVP
jgi:hypothetical protein